MNINMTEFEGFDLYHVTDLQQFLLIRPESSARFLADVGEYYALLQDFLLKVLTMGDAIEDLKQMVPMLDQFYWLDDPDRTSSRRILLPIDPGEMGTVTVMSVQDLIDQAEAAQAMADTVKTVENPEEFVNHVLEGAGIDTDSEMANIARSAVQTNETIN